MDFKALLEQVVSLFGDLTKQQKVITAVSIVVLFSFLSFIVLVDFTPESGESDNYKILFKNIKPENVSSIIDELRKSDTPYKLKNETTILVPKEFIYEQRIKIASLGIIKSDGVGFELFDKREFGETDFDQNIKYLRAIEGELSKTIESLEPVKSATVHLALPKESVFVVKSIAPTASVVIKLKNGSTINIKQVRGIKYLIASAIPRLTIENVKVVDGNGNTLGDDDELSMANELAKTQMKYKKKYERNYEDKIVSILAPVVGGRESVSAKVTIDFDFTRTDATKEAYDPRNVIRSEQKLDEKRDGFQPKDIGGIPGAVSNVGPVKGLDDNGQPTEKYAKTKTTVNYEISKLISTTKSEFAKIKKISVAVIVDGEYIKEHNETEDEEYYKYIKLSENKMSQIEKLVKNTIGYQKSRKDQVTISNFQFNRVSLPEIKSKYEKILDLVEPYIWLFKYIIALIILIILYKFIISPFASKMLEVEVKNTEKQATMLKLNEISNLNDNVDKLVDIRKKVENSLDYDGTIDEDVVKYDIILEKVREIINEKPDDCAKTLASLIQPEIKSNILGDM
jgi:flagellar M-ring protein FliF